MLSFNGGENALRYSTPFWNAFGGVEMTTVLCTRCQSTSTKYDMFHSLSMPIPAKSDLRIEDVLRSFWCPERLLGDNDVCRHCQGRQTRELRRSVSRWPSVLVLHLKRWEVIRTLGFQMRKNDKHVSFETVLNVGDGCGSHSLRGVIEHTGGVAGGHYTAFCRAQDNLWYFCNDAPALPRRATTEEVLKSVAYILVYER